MIDIHSHALPGVDDGAANLEVALEMLRAAAAEGTTAVVLTPHVRSEDGPERDSLHREVFDSFLEAVADAGIEVGLHLGAEIAFRFGLAEVAAWPSVGLAGTRFVLVDLAAGPLSPGLEQGFFELRSSGRRPILAHPERQRELARSPERLGRLHEQEVLIQLDAGSLTGRFGRRARAAAEDFLARGWVDYVASDGHDLERRPMGLASTRQQLLDLAGADEVERLMHENPQRLLRGEEPLPGRRPVASAWWKRLLGH